MRFTGKVVIVTGSTKGIGPHTARAFAAEGAKVIITGRSRGLGDQLAQEINDSGGTAAFLPADLADLDACASLVSRTVQTFGRLDVLVNNAAPVDVMAAGDGRIVSTDMAVFDQVMRVGLYAPVCLTKHAIPHMLDVGGGAIVNMSSIAGVQAVPGMAAYSCSKGALQAFTREIAGDYGKQGIRSNCIIIGSIMTDTWGPVIHGNPIVAQAFQQFTMSKDASLGEPADIAATAVFLASAEAKFINGVFLPVDGGATARSTFPDLSEVFADQTGVAQLERDTLIRQAEPAALGRGQ
ncbi:MAG TPA: SDR family oxidoreductase [Pseudonocardia sp.]|jgi:NAD(P)-dependent dehydrogenase (short-subunit alcohol dehydrogenase family)